MSTADAVAAALAPDLEVIDHGQVLQVVTPSGEHVALVGFDPLQVELELSVVLPIPDDVDDEALQAWAAAADRHLRNAAVPTWAEAGFVVPSVGALAEGEVVDDPERIIWSYELPVTVRATSPAQVAEILAWAADHDREFVLWAVDGPMTPLEVA